MSRAPARGRARGGRLVKRRRILALAVCCSMLLSGCSAMLERGHETVSTHVDYAVTEDESILRAETYQGLVNAILYFVGGHRTKGTIRLYNYTGDVDADLANARDEVLYEDPMGAFSVRALTCEATRILTYYEVELEIAYSRTVQEVTALREVTGLAGVRQELARLITEQRGSAVFLASYFSGDHTLVERLLDLACLNAPELFRHHDISVKTISLYPETGIRRIVEVKLSWGQSIDAVAAEEKEYSQRLETAAAALLEANPPAGEGYTVEELAAIVRASNGGPGGRNASPLALDALSGEPVSDMGLLMAMEHLCRQCGVEVEPVSGSDGLWLIVATPEGYRHLLPQGLYPTQEVDEEDPDAEPPEPVQLLYTDQELAALGREWPAGLHPVCEDYAATAQMDLGHDLE